MRHRASCKVDRKALRKEITASFTAYKKLKKYSSDCFCVPISYSYLAGVCLVPYVSNILMTSRVGPTLILLHTITTPTGSELDVVTEWAPLCIPGS